jgi:hypothetical protein
MKRSNDRESKPTSSDMMDILKRLEAEDEISHMLVKGVPIWPLLRVRWFFSEWKRLYTKDDSSDVLSSKLIKVLQKLGMWMARVVDYRLVVPLKLEGHRRTEVVFLSDGVSFVNLEGVLYERFCDPLIEQAAQLGLRSVMWSPVDVRKSLGSSKLWSAQASLSFGTVVAALLAKIERIDAEQISQVDSLVFKLKSISCRSARFSRSNVLTDAIRVRIFRRVFQKRLAIVKPRLACVVNYYSLEGMSFVWACKSLGIPTVDLQHGVQGSLHPAYASWRVNGIRESTLPLLPNCFWVWSHLEAGVISQWADHSGHRSFVGGNPWVTLWKDCSHRIPSIVSLSEKAKLLAGRANKKPIVLVTLQFGFEYGEQLGPLKALIGLGANDYVFWVRLHPLMMERREEIRHYLAEYPVELDEVSDLPLPSLLPHCNIHVTHSSSAVIEAGDYGIHSLITSRFGVELFPEQLSYGMAVDASKGPEDVFRALGQSIQHQHAVQKREFDAPRAPFKRLLEDLDITLIG